MQISARAEPSLSEAIIKLEKKKNRRWGGEEGCHLRPWGSSLDAVLEGSHMPSLDSGACWVSPPREGGQTR